MRFNIPTASMASASENLSSNQVIEKCQRSFNSKFLSSFRMFKDTFLEKILHYKNQFILSKLLSIKFF
jgi:hypothetical protein